MLTCAAPVPRKKEGRAARLAALERDANGGSITSTVPETGEPVTAPDSGVEEESRGDEGQPRLDGEGDERSRAGEGELKSNGQMDRESRAEEDSKQVAEVSA